MSIIESKHFINGIEVRPRDADMIGVELDWTGDAQENELNVDSLVLEKDAKRLVLDHIATYGVFEGLPYTFQINNTFTLEYYIDLTDLATKISGFGDSGIEVKIKKRRGLATFWENAHGLSFELLNKKVAIPLVDVKYLIVPDNQLEMLIMLGISSYTLTKALIEGVRELVVAVTDFLKIVSVGAVVNTGQIISAGLLLVARTIYVAGLIIALIDVTKQIIELIFPPVRKLKASTVLQLMQTGCGFLGFNFESQLLESKKDLTICPVPLKKDNESILANLLTLNNGSYTKGYPTARDTIATFGQLMETLREMFNGKFRIFNGTVYFERRDYWELDSGLQIQSTLTLQDKRENRWGYNTSEAWKRYYMHYRYDISDWHTLDKIQATDCEYSTEPVSVVNSDLVNIKGLVDIAIPFAFGIRKESLTFVEKVAIPFAKLADEVIQFFGGDSALESKINGRVGVMMIGQQYFTVTKLLYCLNGSQPSNYLDIIGANQLYQQYHTINQVKENFKRIYTETIPFSTAQFEQLIYNNYVQDQSGNLLEILTFEWTNEGKEAEITYAQKSGEGFNTKTILIDA